MDEHEHVVHSEKGFDQSEVPAEQANQTPLVGKDAIRKAAAEAAQEKQAGEGSS